MSILTRGSNPAISLFETWADIHPFREEWLGRQTYQPYFSPWGGPELKGTRFAWGGHRMNIAWLAGGAGIVLGKHYAYRYALGTYLILLADGRFAMRSIWGESNRHELARSTFLRTGYIASQSRWGATEDLSLTYLTRETADQCSQISQSTVLNKYGLEIVWELTKQEHGWGITYATDQSFPGKFEYSRTTPDVTSSVFEAEERRRLKRLASRGRVSTPRASRNGPIVDHTKTIEQIAALLEPHAPANSSPHPKVRLKEATA